MNQMQLEAWVLDVVARVESGQKVEDSRVELKSSAPAPDKAARRLAGHANANASENILWIIGIDEDSGAVGHDPPDLADWLPAVTAEFDGLPPDLRYNLVVPTPNGAVTALLFESVRAPFVVKNPASGRRGGGPVTHEVPWREGTAVRTARRSDLVRLLAPIQRLPEVEILSASLVASRQRTDDRQVGRPEPPPGHAGEFWALDASVGLYFYPPQGDAQVIPVHRCSVRLDAPTHDFSVLLPKLGFYAPSTYTGHGFRPDSVTVQTTDNEAIFNGPGKIQLHASNSVPPGDPGVLSAPARLRIQMKPAHTRMGIQFDVPLKIEMEDSQRTKWGLD